MTNEQFMRLIHAVVSGDLARVHEMIGNAPELIRRPAGAGATREESTEYFFSEIHHYMYAGDTALHMAAAGFRSDIAQLLLDHGAQCSARNRRGAEPLHYAADANACNPAGQVATIRCLLRAGASPDAVDKSGVTPLHRAVRTRSAAAVETLLAGGALPELRNHSGSTPLHLAVQNTGRGGSGSPQSREQQREIIRILLRHGARPDAPDGKGKTAKQAAITAWVRELLESGV